jgi:hypothetical protein
MLRFEGVNCVGQHYIGKINLGDAFIKSIMERENGKLMKLELSKLVQPLHVRMDNKFKEF